MTNSVPQRHMPVLTGNPLRICMAAGHFLPNIGGVERYIYNLSKALMQQGAHVAVAATQLDNTPLAERLDGLDVFRIPSLQLAGGRLPVPTPMSAAVNRQLEAIADWQPDIFVIHTHLFFSNLYVARLAQRLRKPYVLINHGSGYVAGGNPIVNLGLKAYERFLARSIGKHCAAAFGVSLSAAQWLSEFGIPAEGVIANGVDAAAMPARSMAFRDRLGISPETCLVAFAARLLPEKGADTLLSAFQHIDPASAALVIAGDGPALPTLRAMAGNDPRIHFPGALIHSDVLNLFGAADIMAYPSRYPEGQPTTVLEAGAMGCAVIATPRGGTAELINSPDLGYIVANQMELEAALRRLLDDEPLRKTLGQNLQQQVRMHHDWQAIARSASVTFNSKCHDPAKAVATP
ncbi:MAG: glycosyltransferase family 4 protein [Pseudoxanthomonas sp.]